MFFFLTYISDGTAYFDHSIILYSSSFKSKRNILPGRKKSSTIIEKKKRYFYIPYTEATKKKCNILIKLTIIR